MEYTASPAPAGGNTYPNASFGEIDYVAHSSRTFTTQEYIDMYFFAKGIVIPHHYHGASQVIATYLHRKHGIPLIDFYKKLFDVSKHGAGILNREYIAHTDSLRESLFDMKTWGRPIEGGDDFHFQDNGATAAFLYSNIEEVHEEINNLVKINFNIDTREVSVYNRFILNKYDVYTNEISLNRNWNEWFFNHEELTLDNHILKANRKQYKDLRDHAQNVFWYGRKSKRCFVDTHR